MLDAIPKSPNPESPDPRAALAGWYLRRRHRGLWLLPLTAGLVVCIALLLVRSTAEDPRVNLKASKAAWLALAPPAVPKAENAAEDYALAQQARVLFAKGAGAEDPYVNLNKESKFFEGPNVQAFVANNAAALQCLYAGAAKTKCSWGLDYSLGSSMPLPHLAKMRDNARLLATHARVAAHAGDHQGAAKSIAAIYKLAQHVNTDPLLICSLVSVACIAIADSTVEAISTWDTPTDIDDLAAYRKALWLERDWQAMAVRSLTCERASWLYNMDSLHCGAMLVPGMPSGQSMASPLWYGSDRHCFGAVMDEIIAQASRGEWLREEALNDLIAKHQTGPAMMTLMTLPVQSRVERSYMRGEEQGLVTDAGLAFLLFRFKYGKDAKSLEELVPQFLPAVPKGVYYPEPLRLRIDPKGVDETNNQTGKVTSRDPGTIRIYTLNVDGKDNGGYGWNGSEYNRCKPGEEPCAVFRVPPMKKSDSAPGGKVP